MQTTLRQHDSCFTRRYGEILGWEMLGTIDGKSVKNEFTDELTFQNKLYFIYGGLNRTIILKYTLHI